MVVQELHLGGSRPGSVPICHGTGRVAGEEPGCAQARPNDRIARSQAMRILKQFDCRGEVARAETDDR